MCLSVVFGAKVVFFGSQENLKKNILNSYKNYKYFFLKSYLFPINVSVKREAKYIEICCKT